MTRGGWGGYRQKGGVKKRVKGQKRGTTRRQWVLKERKGRGEGENGPAKKGIIRKETVC